VHSHEAQSLCHRRSPSVRTVATGLGPTATPPDSGGACGAMMDLAILADATDNPLARARTSR
jgi:hypothetical protein